jgi:intracellular sulfur oxidation DsrE/DsrF family protein
MDHLMNDERITVRVTATGQTLEVVVLSKRTGMIEVVLGQGVHSVRCQLSPTRNGMAYAGSAMGREIVYERSRDQVEADIQRANAAHVDYRR